MLQSVIDFRAANNHAPHPVPRGETADGKAGLSATPCSTCRVRDLCLPHGLSVQDVPEIDSLVNTRRKIRRGEALYRMGQRFEMLYAVHSGSFKTSALREDGLEQVISFRVAGELLGIEAIASGFHTSTAVALEDSTVCVLPYQHLESLSHTVPAIQRQLYRVMSAEIVREQGVMMLLGKMRAEERLAMFLLNLSQRLTSLGCSASDFLLRMTREEIGSYLGLTLETVSRLFSRFQMLGLLHVEKKHVSIADAAGLRRLIGGEQWPPGERGTTNRGNPRIRAVA